jgi:hypothetical protein
MPAPTLVSYTETADWVTSATSRATASVSWLAGDVVAVLGGGAGPSSGATFGTPTATGLVFVNQQVVDAASHCPAIVSAVVAGSSGSSAVTLTNGVFSHYGFGVWVWRGSAGIGNSAKSTTPGTGKTINLTPTGGAHAAVIWGAFDWSAEAVYTNGTPTPSNTRESTQDSGQYTIGVYDLLDQASTGAVAYGFTGGGTTAPYSIVALEIKASAGAAAVDSGIKRKRTSRPAPFTPMGEAFRSRKFGRWK